MDAETRGISKVALDVFNIVVPAMQAAGYKRGEAIVGLLFTAYAQSHEMPEDDAPPGTHERWIAAALQWVRKSVVDLGMLAPDAVQAPPKPVLAPSSRSVH